jgi:hypothetical protein
MSESKPITAGASLQCKLLFHPNGQTIDPYQSITYLLSYSMVQSPS